MVVEVMELNGDFEGIFRSRPNRFLSIVDIIKPVKMKGEMVHVHDPGRLKELLYPGNRVLLKKASGKKRKTKWDVIAARFENEWILVHSGYHRVISEWMLRGEFCPIGRLKDIRAEVTVGHSRLDFVCKDADDTVIGVEVKGCTLAVDGVALFPDAPTERGRKHLETLMDMIATGKRAALLVLIFRPDARCFSPNELTDPRFAETFGRATEKGVEVYPLVFRYNGKKVSFLGVIPLCE